MAISIYQNKSGAAQVGNIGSRTISGNLPGIGLAARQNAQNVQTAITAGLQLAQVVAKENKRRLQADGFAAYTQLQQDMLEFEASWSESNQGRSAADAAIAYQDFAKKRSEELGKDLSGIGLQEFQLRSGRESAGAFARGTQYSRAQNQLYQQDVLKGMRVTHQQLIAARPGDYGAISDSRNNLTAALNTFMPGRDHTATLAGWEAEDAGQLINQALANEDIGTASNLFGELKHKLGDNAPVMQMRIMNMQDALNRKALTAQAKSQVAKQNAEVLAQYTALQESLNILDTADRPLAAMEYIENIKDPVMRAKMHTLYEKDAAILKDKQDATDDREIKLFWDEFGNSTYSEQQAALQNNTALSAEGKAFVQKKMDAGESTSDLYDLRIIEDSLPNFTSRAHLREAMQERKLTNDDMDKLEKIWESLNGNDAQNNAIVKTALTRAKAKFTALGLSKEDEAELQYTYSLWLDTQKNAGKTITAPDADNMLRELTATSITGRTTAYGGAEKNMVGLEFGQIPPQSALEIQNQLEANGFENVTMSMIVQEWNSPKNKAYREHALGKYAEDAQFTPKDTTSYTTQGLPTINLINSPGE